MEGIAKIIITNIIVYGAVFGALGLLYRPSKNVNSFTTDHFTVEFSTGVKTIIIFCFLVSVFFMVTNYGNVFGKWRVGTGSGLFANCATNRTVLRSKTDAERSERTH